MIGAGPAGITLARALRGSGRRVLILESGGFEPEPDTQALYEGEREGAPFLFNGTEMPLTASRLRWFGGTSNHWGGLCRVFDPEDFDEWPIGPGDLQPYYGDAHDLCQLGPPNYDPRFWRALAGGDRVSLGPQLEPVMFQLSPPTKFGQTYRGDLVDHPDITVCTHANATRLTLDAAGEAVAAVELATLGGPTLRAEGKAFVLATGGVEVPRLLLASNDRRPAGIGNEHDLVGRYFCDHLVYHGAQAVVTASSAQLKVFNIGFYRVPQAAGGKGQHAGAIGALGLTAAARRQHGLRGSVAFLVSPPGLAATPELRGHLASDDVAALAKRVEGGPTPRRVPLLVLAEPTADPANRVELSSARDTLGQPRARVRWEPPADDRDNIADTLDVMAAALGAAGAGRMQIERDGKGPRDVDLWIGNHHMGTTRMHADPTRGVVDGQCKVHSVANLHVAGSSVFTAPGFANPTLTIVALALRLANHLRTVVA